MLDTLLIVSMGELGTHLLDAVSRTNLFRRIVAGSRSHQKARERINATRIGAGLEDYFPVLEAIHFDFNDPACTSILRSLSPDVVFSAPSLMPWWRISDPSAGPIPFGGYISLQLAPMATLRERMAEADLTSAWIGASYPDVINPSLVVSGYGPLCGIGNVQEPIPKIRVGVAEALEVDPRNIEVRLVAQHAFEYYAMRDCVPEEIPPYLLHVSHAGRDVSELGHQVLRSPFPFPYDRHFNRVTASAGLSALEALVAQSPTRTHLPGILGLPGGYPVLVDGRSIALDLFAGWTREEAVDVNARAMRWEGIEYLEPDGTIHFADATVDALRALTGETMSQVHPRNAARQASRILAELPTST